MVLGLTSIINWKVWFIILVQLILASTLPIPGRVIRSHLKRKRTSYRLYRMYQKNTFWIIPALYAAGFVLFFCLLYFILRKRRTCCGSKQQEVTEDQKNGETKDSATTKQNDNSRAASNAEQNKINGDNSKLPGAKQTDPAVITAHEIRRDGLNKKHPRQESSHQPAPSVHRKSKGSEITGPEKKKKHSVTATVHRKPTDQMKLLPSEYDEVDLMEKGLRSVAIDHLPSAEINPSHSPAPTMKTDKETARNFEDSPSELDTNTSGNRYPIVHRSPIYYRAPPYLNPPAVKAEIQNEQIIKHSDIISQESRRNRTYRGFELKNNTNDQAQTIGQREKQTEEKPVNKAQFEEIVDEIIARKYRKFLEEEQFKDTCRLGKLAHQPEKQDPQTIESKKMEFHGNHDEVVIDMGTTQGPYNYELHNQYHTSNNTMKPKVNRSTQWSLQKILSRVNRWTQWSRQTLTPENEKWTQCSREPSKDEHELNYRTDSPVTDISYETVVLDKGTQMSFNDLSEINNWNGTENENDLYSIVSCSQTDESTQWSITSDKDYTKHGDAENESSSSDTSVNTVVNTTNPSHKHSRMSARDSTGDLDVRRQSLTEPTTTDNAVCSTENRKVDSPAMSVRTIGTNQQQIGLENEKQTSAYAEVAPVMPERLYTYEYYYSYGEVDSEKPQNGESADKKTAHSPIVQTILNANDDDVELSKDSTEKETIRHEHESKSEQKPDISERDNTKSDSHSTPSRYQFNIHKEIQSGRCSSKSQYQQAKPEYREDVLNRHQTLSEIRSMLQQSLPNEKDKCSTTKYYDLDGSDLLVLRSTTSKEQDVTAKINTENDAQKISSSIQAAHSMLRKRSDIENNIETRTPDTHTETTRTTMYLTDKENRVSYPFIDKSKQRKTAYAQKSVSASKYEIEEYIVESEPTTSRSSYISAAENRDGKGIKFPTLCCFWSNKQNKSVGNNGSTTEDESQEVESIYEEEQIETTDNSSAIHSDSETIVSAKSIALRKSLLIDRMVGSSDTSMNTVESDETSEINSCNSKRSSTRPSIFQQWLTQQQSTVYETSSCENQQSGVSTSVGSYNGDATDTKQEQVESFGNISMELTEESTNPIHRQLDSELSRLVFEDINPIHHEKRTSDLIKKHGESHRKLNKPSDDLETFPPSKRKSFSQNVDSMKRSSGTLEKQQENVATHLEDSSAPNTLNKGTNTKDDFNSNVVDAEQDHAERIDSSVFNHVRISFAYRRLRLFRFPRTRRWLNRRRQRWRERRRR